MAQGSGLGLVALWDEQADEGAGEPVLVPVGIPVLFDDEPVVDAGVVEQPEDIGGLGWRQVWLERAAVGRVAIPGVFFLGDAVCTTYPVRDKARAVLRTGWRPPYAAGPSRDELAGLLRRPAAMTAA